MKRKPKTKNQKPKIKRTSPSRKKMAKKLYPKRALKKFKQILIQQREKFVGEMERITSETLKKSQRDASGDLSGYTFHMADMATDHYDREFSLGLATAEQRIIYEIDEALKRIEDGSYGVCLSCDKPISKSRLKAIPYTKYCVSCQQKEELMQKRSA